MNREKIISFVRNHLLFSVSLLVVISIVVIGFISTLNSIDEVQVDESSSTHNHLEVVKVDFEVSLDEYVYSALSDGRLILEIPISRMGLEEQQRVTSVLPNLPETEGFFPTPAISVIYDQLSGEYEIPPVQMYKLQEFAIEGESKYLALGNGELFLMDQDFTNISPFRSDNVGYVTDYYFDVVANILYITSQEVSTTGNTQVNMVSLDPSQLGDRGGFRLLELNNFNLSGFSEIEEDQRIGFEIQDYLENAFLGLIPNTQQSNNSGTPFVDDEEIISIVAQNEYYPLDYSEQLIVSTYYENTIWIQDRQGTLNRQLEGERFSKYIVTSCPQFSSICYVFDPLKKQVVEINSAPSGAGVVIKDVLNDTVFTATNIDVAEIVYGFQKFQMMRYDQNDGLEYFYAGEWIQLEF